MIERLKLFAFVTLFFFITVFSYAQSTSSIYQKARIHYSSKNDIINLQNNGVGIDHGIQYSKNYVESVFSINEISQAKKLGYQVDILIEDMQHHILERNKNSQKVNLKNSTPCVDTTIDYPTPMNFNLGTMGGYLTYTEILQELDDMRSAYPNLITAKASISTFTTEDGNTLQWVKNF